MHRAIAIEIVIPQEDNAGRPYPPEVTAELEAVKRTYAQKFGGLTHYVGMGYWHHAGNTQREPVNIWRIIAAEYSPAYWRRQTRILAALLDQEEIFCTAGSVELA